MDNLRSDYANIVGGFVIFAKYPEDTGYVSAEHDEIYAGPSPEVVSEEDKELLETLGWHDCDGGCFRKYT